MTPLCSAQVESVRHGTVCVWFALNRAALLGANAPDIVVAEVRSWEDDGRPFWVEVDYQRRWLRRPSRHCPNGLRQSPDLYGFEVPRTFRAPAWWLDAYASWRARGSDA
jgi:hypothetical protein